MKTNNVLIVEDEAIIALSLELFIKKIGYNVIDRAQTGSDAVRIASEKRPDIILMDISLLGEMDGIEAAIRINSINGMAIIFITGNSDQSTQDRAMAAHPVAYLNKPVEYSILEEVLDRIA